MGYGISIRKGVRKYWKQILLFGGFTGILLYCSPLDITQISAGDKCFSLLYGATSYVHGYYAPVYMGLGWIVTRLPMLDGMAMSLFLSLIPAVGSVILVYLVIKIKTDDKYAPWIGTLVVMGGWSYFTQALKVETYVLGGFFLILGYYLVTKRKFTWSAVSLGLAVGCHWMAIPIAAGAMVLYQKELWKKVYICIGVPVALYCAYLYTAGPYVPGAQADFMSMKDSLFMRMAWSYIQGDISWTGHLLQRGTAILLFTFGLGLIPLAYYIKRTPIKEAFPIVFPFGVIAILCLAGTHDVGYMGFAPIVPLVGVGVGLGVQHMKAKHLEKIVLVGVLLPVLLLPVVFGNFDTNPTTARAMVNELDTIPEGSLVICERAAFTGEKVQGKTSVFTPDGFCANSVGSAVLYYNRENPDRNIIQVYPYYIWASPEYMAAMTGDDLLKGKGVNLPGHFYQFPDGRKVLYFWFGNLDYDMYLAEIRLKAVNPDRNVYIYRILDTGTFRSVLQEIILRDE